MEILVFKTNVSSKKKISKVGALLSGIPTIKQWSFDLDDCDKVLRIVAATKLNTGFVESLLKAEGFNCQELD